MYFLSAWQSGFSIRRVTRTILEARYERALLLSDRQTRLGAKR
jgi:hypothetical protein